MEQRSPRQPETAAERAERWKAESALATPRSRFAVAVGDHLPAVLGWSVAAVAVAAIGYVVLDVAHRDEPGGDTTAGRLTAGTCFSVDPNDFFEGTESRVTLPTVRCGEPHLAEAYLTYDASTTSDVEAQCLSAWDERSDIPVEVSGVYLTGIETTTDEVTDGGICVAVGPEPVKGFSLDAWQP